LIKLLPRALELAVHSEVGLQVAASEFVHSVVIYTIGKATAQAKTQADQQLKQSCATIYRKVLPKVL
jgi:hypothetical protein